MLVRMLASASSRSLARPTADPRLALSLLAVYVIWSSTYLVMRIAVVELPPLPVGATTVIANAMIVLAVFLALRGPRPAGA